MVLFNGGLFLHVNVSVTWAELGWSSGSVRVRDLWQKADLGLIESGYSADIAPRDVVYLRLTLQNNQTK